MNSITESEGQSVSGRSVQRQLQRSQTRQLIVKTAIPVFARLGPDSPVIDDFVKAAGVSRGTFYNYFRTTRELLDAAMATLSDEFIQSIVPLVESERNPVIRLATAARMFYRRATVDPVFRGFLGSVSGVGSLAQERARADLEEAIGQGLITTTDLDLAEAVAYGVMVYALRSTRVDVAGHERGQAVVRAIFQGLGAPASLIDQALAVRLPADEPVQGFG